MTFLGWVVPLLVASIGVGMIARAAVAVDDLDRLPVMGFGVLLVAAAVMLHLVAGVVL